MQKKTLGTSGIEVTELGFGTLCMGPLQAGLSVDEGGALIRYALEQGVNFIDTAAMYGTYAHVHRALKGWDEPVVVATKTHAVDYAGAQEHIEAALEDMGLDQLDIVHAHGHRIADLLNARADVLRCLLDYKAKGLIRAVGVSTHRVSVARQAAEHPDIDVIHPLINHTGIGIIDGTPAEMLAALAVAHAHGKGIYAMKALGGGNLLDDREANLRWVLDRPEMDAAVVGMLRRSEIDFNLHVARREPVPDAVRARTPVESKRMIVLSYCQRCGTCVEACPNEAISLGPEHAQIDPDRCVLCGYCAPTCPEFALRMV
ncbi:MAG: aldo/keto reductase [Chloroflexi bacterium]|nr:aldo/keto reductase [Chloroflexota bacterium]MBU1748425.1 aldo/keto reductase [Chloroflexota bacterium]MBU1878347.1 aldo/keto reductase [Chloroflexota bacterium]